MTVRPGRLAGLRRRIGAALFLALCGHAAYTATARGRDAAVSPARTCGAASPCEPSCAAMPQG